MPQYTVQTMPDLKGQGHTVKYPRMLIRERICLRTLAEHIEQSSSFTVADVEGVMAAVSRQLSRLAAQGCSVKIDGLGTFCPTLGWRKGVERESAVGGKRNAVSIEVDGFSFRPDKELVRTTQTHCLLQRAHAPSYASPSQDSKERWEAARRHLERNGRLTVGEYACIGRLSRSSASRELKRFLDQGLLSTRGRAPHRYYILPPAAEERNP